jgi:hypothetical protein
MNAVTVKQRFEDINAPAAKKPQLRLRQLLPLTNCFCRLRIMDSFDGRYDDVTMAASSGPVLLEKLSRSRAVDGELLLDLVPQLDTVDDSVLRFSVQVPPPKPKPKFTGVDCAAELKELMDAVMEYNSDRDAEWDFAEDHGVEASYWTEEQVEEHDQILADIQRNRERIQGILRRVTGDVTLEF